MVLDKYTVENEKFSRNTEKSKISKSFLKNKTRKDYELLMPAGSLEKAKYAIHLFFEARIYRWLSAPVIIASPSPNSPKKAGKKHLFGDY